MSYIPLGDIEAHTNEHDNMTRRLFREELNPMRMNISGMILDVLYGSTGRGNTHNAHDTSASISRLSRLHNLTALLVDHGQVDDDDGYEFNTYISHLIGDVEVGVADIERVSHLVSEHEHSAGDCHICLDEIKTPRKLLCKHVFCDACISQWLGKNKKCPVCRLDLEEALKEDEKFEDAINQ